LDKKDIRDCIFGQMLSWSSNFYYFLISTLFRSNCALDILFFKAVSLYMQACQVHLFIGILFIILICRNISHRVGRCCFKNIDL